ncbi:hypothetical protein Q5752_005515 [Cryptotrichosporon argae]
MRTLAACVLAAALVRAHGDHAEGFKFDEGLSYAEQHMLSEHHIDTFDLPSFFKLHDLDSDGFWDRAEIAAVYGLHHHSVRDRVPDDGAREGRTQVVVDRVLEKLDADKDGKVSLEEFVAGGKDGLPSFAGFADLGHHYDEESEYFLHHEEMYHSTPETQTDQSYTHPEDHAHIEAEEDARERIFEGLDAAADLSKDHIAADPLDVHAHAAGEGPARTEAERALEAALDHLQPGDEAPPPPRIERAMPGAQPNRIQRKGSAGAADAKGEWNEAGERARDAGAWEHGRPRSAEDRLRAGTPYKYKFRKGLRADEF